jgi:hypothetical protein
LLLGYAVDATAAREDVARVHEHYLTVRVRLLEDALRDAIVVIVE